MRRGRLTMESEMQERPLHVLLVHVWYWPHVGGGDQHVEQIGMELVRRGHRVTVWCADVPANDEKRYNRGGVDVIRIEPSTVLGGVDPLVSVKDLDMSDVDVVHLHDTLPVLIRRTLAKARASGKPIVTTYHNDYVKHTAAGRLLKRLRWRLQGLRTLNSSDARIVLTPYFEQLLRSKGVNGELEIIPNGFSPIEESPQTPQILADRDSSRPLLVFVGRLSEQKGIDVMMDAWDIVASEGDPGYDLAIAGDGELRTWLTKRCSEANCASNISLLGLVTESEKRWLFENGTAVVIPSRFEGLPTVLLESMYAGTPVIMTDVSGLGSLLSETGAGITIQPEDPSSLASAMDEIALANREKLDDWGGKGSIASKKYLWSSVVDRVLEVYRRVSSD